MVWIEVEDRALSPPSCDYHIGGPTLILQPLLQMLEAVPLFCEYVAMAIDRTFTVPVNVTCMLNPEAEEKEERLK